MRLIVFKDLDTKYRYGDKIIENLPFNRSSQTVGKNVLLLTADRYDISSLKGYNFTDVLWVGYEDSQNRDFTAPMELLVQTHGAKHHYCKPAESSFDRAMTTNSLRFGKSTSKDDTLDALRYFMPMKVKVNGEDILVSKEDL